ncbi:hypothetical protein [Aureivirga sp. CE67]|uniref:hypothetical protein n=1 Tax=Aureivirga sp. CE67 TaxID=1788983 RepID=UPI0018CB543F|nr:hypothetical protein [Aureivirga sp. CE67]
MDQIDWILLIIISLFIVGQGIYLTWKERQKDGDDPYTFRQINLSVVTSQFSITSLIFIPSHAYHVGMGFIQYYFGVPIAIILITIIFMPFYNRYAREHKIKTAYGFLEKRFDKKTRIMLSMFVLLQNGLATGMIIIAPSIIISSILHLNIYWTNLIIASIVILFILYIEISVLSTIRKYQMYLIVTLMIITFIVLIYKLPEGVTFGNAINLAGYSDKLNLINYELELEQKYNIWTAIFGSSILFLSIYSVNQRSVRSYLSDKPIHFIRWKLVLKALTKIPVMFLILFLAVMIYVFHIFYKTPLHFNQSNVNQIENSAYAEPYNDVEDRLETAFDQKKAIAYLILDKEAKGEEISENLKADLVELEETEDKIRAEGRDLIAKFEKSKGIHINEYDKDYVFISFIRDYLPKGLVGIVLGLLFFTSIFIVIYSLGNLSKNTLYDVFYKFYTKKVSGELHEKLKDYFKYLWLIFGILFATFINPKTNLIEALIIVASLFYGAAFGLFAIGFLVKFIKKKAAFWAFIVSEICIIGLFIYERIIDAMFSYLWLNLLGLVFMFFFSFLFQIFFNIFNLNDPEIHEENEETEKTDENIEENPVEN